MGGPYWMLDHATQADYAEPPVKSREPRNAERDGELWRRWAYEGVRLRDLATQYGLSISGVSRAIDRFWKRSQK